VTKKYWRRSAACCIVKDHRISDSVSLIWQWLCENWWLSTGAPKPPPGGGSVFVLGAAFFFAPPPGSAAAGAGPSWVGGTRGMPSGEILGKNGPAAGALIGLSQTQAQAPNDALG
jgi:hypothetical protein